MKIVMPYFGTLSVNRYKIHGTYRTRPEVREWIDLLSAEVARKAEMESFIPPLVIKVKGRFKDHRYPDLDNLAKVIQDGVKRGVGIDDKYFLYRPLGCEIGTGSPELEITIENEVVVRGQEDLCSEGS